MKKQNKSNSYYVPSSIQKLFIVPIIALFTTQTGFITVSTLSQANQGSDYRPQLGYLAIYNLLPILIFCFAYFLNPRKLNLLSKIFEALIISVSALITWSAISMLINILYFNHNSINNYRHIEYVSTGVFVSIYLFTLIVLRKKRLWA